MDQKQVVFLRNLISILTATNRIVKNPKRIYLLLFWKHLKCYVCIMIRISCNRTEEVKVGDRWDWIIPVVWPYPGAVFGQACRLVATLRRGFRHCVLHCGRTPPLRPVDVQWLLVEDLAGDVHQPPDLNSGSNQDFAVFLHHLHGRVDIQDPAGRRRRLPASTGKPSWSALASTS